METSMQAQQAQDRLKEIREEEQAREEEKTREADTAKAESEKERNEALSGPVEPASRDDQRAQDEDARKEDDRAQDDRRDDDKRKVDDRKQDQRRDEDQRKDDDKKRDIPRVQDERAEKAQEAAKTEPKQAEQGVGLDEQVAQAKAAQEAPKSLNTPEGNLTRPNQKSVLNPNDLANQERQQNTPRPAGERANSAEVTPQDSQAEREHRSNAAGNQQGSKASMDAYLAAQAKEAAPQAQTDGVDKALEYAESVTNPTEGLVVQATPIGLMTGGEGKAQPAEKAEVKQAEAKAPAKSSVGERMAARNAESSKVNVEAGKSIPPAKTQAHAEKVDTALGQERAKRVERQESVTPEQKNKARQQELSR